MPAMAALDAYIAALPAAVVALPPLPPLTPSTSAAARPTASRSTSSWSAPSTIANAVSPVKVRTYFRTNQPPDRPAGEMGRRSRSRRRRQGLPARLRRSPTRCFWGDTLTSTWSGISFLWKGSDPDSRDLNIIPLTFSYKLVNDSTGGSFPYPVTTTATTSSASRRAGAPGARLAGHVTPPRTARQLDPNFVLDGHYTFYVRVRDDGLTESDTMATATFTAVAPTFQRQLLIVDWTTHYHAAQPLRPDRRRGDQAVLSG